MELIVIFIKFNVDCKNSNAQWCIGYYSVQLFDSWHRLRRQQDYVSILAITLTDVELYVTAAIYLMFLFENSLLTLGTKARLHPLVSWWCSWLLKGNGSWLKYVGSCFFTSLNKNLSSWHLYISYDFRRCNCLKIGWECARKLLDVMIQIAFVWSFSSALRWAPHNIIP